MNDNVNFSLLYVNLKRTESKQTTQIYVIIYCSPSANLKHPATKHTHEREKKNQKKEHNIRKANNNAYYQLTKTKATIKTVKR